MILLIVFYVFFSFETKGVHKPYSYKAATYDFINYLNSTNISEKGFKVFKMILSKKLFKL